MAFTNRLELETEGKGKARFEGGAFKCAKFVAIDFQIHILPELSFAVGGQTQVFGKHPCGLNANDTTHEGVEIFKSPAKRIRAANVCEGQ